MDNSEIVKAIDEQISRLQEARALLANSAGGRTTATRQAAGGRTGRRKLSAQARANIIAAQKARWAKWKKAQKSA